MLVAAYNSTSSVCCDNRLHAKRFSDKFCGSIAYNSQSQVYAVKKHYSQNMIMTI